MASPLPPGVAERAAIHAALGDPHRLAICDELTLSDRSPSELARKLGLPSNLLAHHLNVLARARLLETIRSAGDGRRHYVRLRRESLLGIGPGVPQLRAASILFVCTGNSARSPLAVAIWRGCSKVPALSAGTRPAERVHPLALAAAARHGLDLAGSVPRAVEMVGLMPGLIVTVCDEAHEELRGMDDVPRLHWSIPDPAASGRRRAFDATVEALRNRIEPLSRAVHAGYRGQGRNDGRT
jgi:protein-tyrosine-phosphatase